jgi:uncharacterized protein YegP (UPF0339 family)
MGKLTLQVYLEQAGAKSHRSPGYRWRLKAPNGRIIADGAEAYVNQRNAITAALYMVRNLRAGPIKFNAGLKDHKGRLLYRDI